MSGYVYVLVNSSLPDLVKIGMTGNDPRERASALSSTGTPGRFIVAYQSQVRDPEKVERLVHEALRDSRDNSNREFFRTSSTKAIETVQQVAASYRIENGEDIEPSFDFPGCPYLVVYHAKIAGSAHRLGAMPVWSGAFDEESLRADLKHFYELHDFEVSLSDIRLDWEIRVAEDLQEAKLQLEREIQTIFLYFARQNSNFSVRPDSQTLHHRASRGSDDRHAITLLFNKITRSLDPIAPLWDPAMEQKQFESSKRLRDMAAAKSRL